jgi:chaperonin GroEL
VAEKPKAKAEPGGGGHNHGGMGGMDDMGGMGGMGM